MQFKSTLLALALVAASSSAFASSAAITDMSLSSGTFYMAGVSASPTAWTNTANPTANLVGSYNSFGALFNFFGHNVSAYTAASNLGDANTAAGTIAGGPIPSGTMDTTAGTLNVNLSSLFANWNGSDFNQGNSSVTGTLSGCSGNTCTYNMSWSSLIVGGAFNGYTGTWTATGTAIAAVPEASTYGMMVVGLGLVGAAVMRRRKA